MIDQSIQPPPHFIKNQTGDSGPSSSALAPFCIAAAVAAEPFVSLALEAADGLPTADAELVLGSGATATVAGSVVRRVCICGGWVVGRTIDHKGWASMHSDIHIHGLSPTNADIHFTMYV